MIITPIKTEKILPNQIPLLKLLDTSIKKFPERSILAITSKIIALCEGRIVSLDENKDKLIEQEAAYYLPKRFRRFGSSGTITHSAFIGAAGIDESNTSGHYLLLPADSQKTANEVYRYIKNASACEKPASSSSTATRHRSAEEHPVSRSRIADLSDSKTIAGTKIFSEGNS